MKVPGNCLLFVYGSLKRGHANHGQLAGARFVAEARTVPRFALRVIAGYPALVPGAQAILGELFELNNAGLAALDEFEGNDYVREEVELEAFGPALAYLSRTPTAGAPYSANEWQG